MKYVVISKKSSHAHGHEVLMSFATHPLWKSFEEIRRQGDELPNYYDHKTALYARNKYAQNNNYEIILLAEAQQKLDQYITDNPNWQ